MMQDRVILGYVAGVHGVKGWLKIYSYTDPPENILDYPVWQLQQQGRWQAVQVLETRQLDKQILALFNHCNDRDIAKQWLGAEIAVDRDQLPALADDEYYWADLIGLNVTSITGKTLGKVTQLLATGANDVLVVQGEQQHHIPYLPQQTIIAVDLPNQSMIVDWSGEYI